MNGLFKGIFGGEMEKGVENKKQEALFRTTKEQDVLSAFIDRTASHLTEEKKDEIRAYAFTYFLSTLRVANKEGLNGIIYPTTEQAIQQLFEK